MKKRKKQQWHDLGAMTYVDRKLYTALKKYVKSRFAYATGLLCEGVMLDIAMVLLRANLAEYQEVPDHAERVFVCLVKGCRDSCFEDLVYSASYVQDIRST